MPSLSSIVEHFMHKLCSVFAGTKLLLHSIILVFVVFKKPASYLLVYNLFKHSVVMAKCISAVSSPRGHVCCISSQQSPLK